GRCAPAPMTATRRAGARGPPCRAGRCVRGPGRGRDRRCRGGGAGRAVTAGLVATVRPGPMRAATVPTAADPAPGPLPTAPSPPPRGAGRPGDGRPVGPRRSASLQRLVHGAGEGLPVDDRVAVRPFAHAPGGALVGVVPAPLDPEGA